LIAAGKLSDSPRPREKRASAKPSKLLANARLIAARLQMPIASARAEAVDHRAAAQQAQRIGGLERGDDVAVFDLLQSICTCRNGASTPSTWRSM
jgi:hypothetical protein